MASFSVVADKPRCDLAQPNCERCQRSGRVCEGYAKGPVFLNRTAKGLMKRGRLEEALPHRGSTVAESSQASASAQLAAHRLPAQVGTVAVHDARLEGSFLERHLPSEGPRQSSDPIPYLRGIMMSASRGRALEPALRALWMTRMARMTKNRDLLMRGRQHYGVSLRQLQGCLSDVELAIGEETLATAQILSLYEVRYSKWCSSKRAQSKTRKLYESTGSSVGAHDSHIAGLVRIFQWRGRASVRSNLSQLILQIVRWNAVRIPLGNLSGVS